MAGSEIQRQLLKITKEFIMAKAKNTDKDKKKNRNDKRKKQNDKKSKRKQNIAKNNTRH